MITIKELPIPDVKIVTPQMFRDDRGYFIEVFKEEEWQKSGLPTHFPQENQSLSVKTFTVRGMHAQKPPAAQGKLVRVLRGRIMDVALDVRPQSPSYGEHVRAHLSDQDATQMYIPPGFLHGFCTLEPNTVVFYKVTQPYSQGSEFGVAWNDPALAIHWPVEPHDAHLSDKDKKLPLFKDFPKTDWS